MTPDPTPRFDLRDARRRRLLRAAGTYAAAVALAVAATGIRLLIDPLLGPKRLGFITFFGAIVIAAWVGGPGPALVSLLVSLAAFVYLFVEPRYTFVPANPSDLWSILIAAGVGVLVAMLAGSLQRARRNAERDRAVAAAAVEQFRLATESIPQIVWTQRPDGAIDYLNTRWYEYTGLPRGQSLAPDATSAAIHPDDLPAARAIWDEKQGAGEAYEHEMRLRGKDGSYRWFLVRNSPLRDARTGRVIRWFGTSTDVEDLRRARADADTRRAEAEAERAEADAQRARAEEASRVKDEFLATLSHELRTPMNAIRGWTQLLGDGRGLPEEEIVEGLGAIDRNARALAELVDDLLDLSRVITGRLRLDLRPLDLRDVVAAAVETVRPAAAARGVDLSLDAGAAPVPVAGDANRLQQVAWNLLSNAVKFARERGHVRAVVDAMPAADGHAAGGAARLRVVDDGAGLDPAFLPHLFERFRQVDSSTTRKAGGLGIGLSLVRSLTELHGGTATAHSDGPGRGSTFTVTLPLAGAGVPEQQARGSDGGRGAVRQAASGESHAGGETRASPFAGDAAAPPAPAFAPATPLAASRTDAAAPAQSSPAIASPAVAAVESTDPARAKSSSPRPSLAGVRVLVVDDEPDARDVVRRALRDRGADVTIATGADEAAAAAERAPPDVLVSDIAMPGADGYELIARVRSAADRRLRSVPAVAVTAFARDADRARVLAAGFDAFVPKPADLRELATIVAELHRKRAAAVAG